MANLLTRVILFLSSYAPLWVTLAIRNTFGIAYIQWALIALAIASVIALLAYLRLAHSQSTFAVKAKSVVVRDGEAMSYIVTYLLPFFELKPAEPTSAISMAIVLAVLGVLYVNSNLIHMNPILNLVGYRVFEVVTDSDKTLTLICRRR